MTRDEYFAKWPWNPNKKLTAPMPKKQVKDLFAVIETDLKKEKKECHEKL
jgi:hypothetical protein